MPPPPGPDERAASPRIEVLGVRFDNLTRAEAAKAIAVLAGTGRGAYVVKPYSEYMPPAARDSRLRDVLNGADLCLADGIGILWAAHYASLPGGTPRALLQLPLSLASLAFNPSAVRQPLKEAMAGVDLTEAMLARLAEDRRSVFLLGGREEEVRGTRERVAARFPGLRIAGALNGYFDPRGEANQRVVRSINEAAPDVLLVATGFPRQEEWIADNLPGLRVNVAIAEGGSFSFMSGGVSRAPRPLRRMGLEWLYRLLRQPWRLRRQTALPRFVYLVVKDRLTGTQVGPRASGPA